MAINHPPEALVQWFVEALKREQLPPQTISYDGNTDYDRMYQRLQFEAERYWRLRYGYAPTPGHLVNAFFQAEHFLSRERRLQPVWSRVMAWLSDSRE
ncbi:hypothetical protein CHH28_11555 [Bacterioplanes sanyensis]|uniref:Uncharacterized protein n=1 Tax=Bacterioplanes sanyensis TaxID=1249553 RepID=A0A222FKT9_9GAMM|nr:hypothetical protein [Bacterioplanes sanyensis]ASP39272.1 hypothetical protein CHH28_11555 [Bacterioplanes sanyensis]